MIHLTSKTLFVAFVGVLMLLSASFVVAGAGKEESHKTQDRVQTCEGSLPTVTVLPPRVTKSLKLTPVPTSEPIPLVAATYWICAPNGHGFETCRIKLVVCPTDTSDGCFQID